MEYNPYDFVVEERIISMATLHKRGNFFYAEIYKNQTSLTICGFLLSFFL
jgi:hypothetical protein